MTSKAVYYPVAGEGRGVATSSEAWWIRAVSRLVGNKSEPNELWEQKRRTLLTRASSILPPGWNSPLFESMVSKEERERHSSKEIEENDIPWISIAVCSPLPSSPGWLGRGFLHWQSWFSNEPPGIVRFEELSLHPSPFSPPPRFTLGTSRRTKTIVDHGPASWVAINRGPDLDFQAGRRPVFAAFDSSLGREHFHYFRSGGNSNDKTLFPLHFPTGMDGWIDLFARWHALLHYDFELSNWARVYHSDLRRWQLLKFVVHVSRGRFLIFG